jgi:hypothetical protein
MKSLSVVWFNHQALFEGARSSAECVHRLQEALAELLQHQTSLPLVSPQPFTLSAGRLAAGAAPSGADFDDMTAHAEALLGASHLAARVASEYPHIQEAHERMWHLQAAVERQLKASKTQQRAAERLVTAATTSAHVALLLENERGHMRDEDAKVATLMRLSELVRPLAGNLRGARDLLADVTPLGAPSALGHFQRAARLLESERARRLALLGGAVGFVGMGVGDRNEISSQDLHYQTGGSDRDEGGGGVRQVATQLQLVSGLHFISDEGKEDALAFIQYVVGLDGELARHAAANGLLDMLLLVVKVLNPQPSTLNPPTARWTCSGTS